MVSTTDKINVTTPEEVTAVAFSRQSEHYDEDDFQNPILQEWRKQVYDHVFAYLRSGDGLLELNAGTGIDALYFVNRGVSVLATDVSEGMVNQIRSKAERLTSSVDFQVEKCSYEALDKISQNNFDYIFSNFGGLNCIQDLSKVTRHLPQLIGHRGHLTFVIMPPVSLWEWILILKGKFKRAFRRLKKGGVMAHLEGTYFPVYYHSLSSITKAIGPSFKLVRIEGLGSLSPPPSATNFCTNHPGLYRFLKKADRLVKDYYPFNRCADHCIVTFQKSAIP